MNRNYLPLLLGLCPGTSPLLVAQSAPPTRTPLHGRNLFADTDNDLQHEMTTVIERSNIERWKTV